MGEFEIRAVHPSEEIRKRGEHWNVTDWRLSENEPYMLESRKVPVEDKIELAKSVLFSTWYAAADCDGLVGTYTSNLSRLIFYLSVAYHDGKFVPNVSMEKWGYSLLTKTDVPVVAAKPPGVVSISLVDDGDDEESEPKPIPPPATE